MEYRTKSVDDQKASLEARLAEIETEHLNNMTRLAEATAAGDEAEMQRLSDNVRTIEASHAELASQIDGLKVSKNDAKMGSTPVVAVEVLPEVVEEDDEEEA